MTQGWNCLQRQFTALFYLSNHAGYQGTACKPIPGATILDLN
jgi:hypothetical protein